MVDVPPGAVQIEHEAIMVADGWQQRRHFVQGVQEGERSIPGGSSTAADPVTEIEDEVRVGATTLGDLGTHGVDEHPDGITFSLACRCFSGLEIAYHQED